MFLATVSMEIEHTAKYQERGYKIMNLQTKFVLMTAIVSILAIAGMASADAIEVTAHVPFGFVAANQTFESGDFTFGVDDPNEPSVLTVNRAGGKEARVMLTDAGNKAIPMNETQILFDKFQGKYYLSEVWIPGLDQGRVVPKSEIRKERSRVQSAVTVRAN
ncbi:MAG: hypothetical protein BMS9Abin37_0228 [Acidobacteriota bacterium]|nr:MAG: hypothetical protein BMS9Abin37_0228 [Acidobacteriota bacterium]